MSKKKSFGFLLSIGAFCVLYQPPILPFNVLHIVGIVSILYLIIYKKNIFRDTTTKNITIWMLFLALYIFVDVVMFKTGSLSSVSLPIFFAIDIIPFAFVLKSVKEKNNIPNEGIIKLFIICGLVQSFLSALAFFMPQMQQLFINQMTNYGYKTDFARFTSYRMYGFSAGLTYVMPSIQAILAILSIFYGLKTKTSRFYLYSVPLLFSAIINARISFIIFVLGIFALVFFSNVKVQRKILFSIIFGLCVLFFFAYFLPWLSSNSPSVYAWMTDGLDDVFSIFRNNNDGEHFSYFTNPDHYQLPFSLEGVLFGEGYKVTNNPNGYVSDIGFINDIWFGGMVYLTILYLGFFAMFLHVIKIKDGGISRFIGFFFLISCIFLNIKGNIFTMNAISNFIVIYCICIKNIRPYLVKNRLRIDVLNSIPVKVVANEE